MPLKKTVSGRILYDTFRMPDRLFPLLLVLAHLLLSNRITSGLLYKLAAPSHLQIVIAGMMPSLTS